MLSRRGCVEAWRYTLKQLKKSIPCAEFKQSLYYERCSCVISFALSRSLYLFHRLQKVKQRGYFSAILQAYNLWAAAAGIFVGKVRKTLFK